MKKNGRIHYAMFISDITANKRNASPTHLSIITMGLGSNGKKVRYRLEKLTRTEVGIAAAHLQSNNTNDNNTNLGRPAIYVDANNVSIKSVDYQSIQLLVQQSSLKSFQRKD